MSDGELIYLLIGVVYAVYANYKMYTNSKAYTRWQVAGLSLYAVLMWLPIFLVKFGYWVIETGYSGKEKK